MKLSVLCLMAVVTTETLFGCGVADKLSSNHSSNPVTTDGSFVSATNTNFTSSLISGNTYFFDLVLPNNGMHINPETITFNSDGTGTSIGANDGSVTWNIDNSGRLIIVIASTGMNISVAITDASNPFVIKTNLYEYNTSHTIDTAVTATMTIKNTGTPLSFTASDLSGKTFNMTEVTALDGTDTMTVTVKADGTLSTSKGKSATWSINSSGQLVIVGTTTTITMTLTNKTATVFYGTITDIDHTNPAFNTTGTITLIAQ